MHMSNACDHTKLLALFSVELAFLQPKKELFFWGNEQHVNNCTCHIKYCFVNYNFQINSSLTFTL